MVRFLKGESCQGQASGADSRRKARQGPSNMAHEIAKLLLEHAETFLERTEAIKSALSLGMPLADIEEYLDWLDSVRNQNQPAVPKKPRRE